MSQNRTNYPTVDQILAAEEVPQPKAGVIFDTLVKYKIIGGRQVYRNRVGKKLLYYVWDKSPGHGHWEVYSRTGIAWYSIKNDGAVVEIFAKSAGRRKLNL